MGCSICPANCGAIRETEAGKCGVGGVSYVARASLHMYEEPCISGTRGSGTIFFSGCNLKCVFCQNHKISRKSNGKPMDPELLSEIMLDLEERGAHNINLVTPTPHLELIIRSIPKARSAGLSIPIVYNTNAYERVESLKRLEGLIDIYLPDLKYVSKRVSAKYSGAENYFEYASKAVIEMYRQCGDLKTDSNGIAKKGIIIRHLVLPGSVDEARLVLNFISEEIGRFTHVSLMSQYVPMGSALAMPVINRALKKSEYNRAVEHCIAIGLDNTLIQEISSANCKYTPDFNVFFE